MRRPAAPLRFLSLVLGIWVLGRGAILVPQWLRAEPGAVTASLPARATARRLPSPTAAAPSATAVAPIAPPLLPTFTTVLRSPPPVLWASNSVAFAGSGIISAPAPTAVPETYSPALTRPEPATGDAAPASFAPVPPVGARTGRWSGSAWALLRQGPGESLAPGGLLGGSQVGARVTYRLGLDLGLNARAYLPVDRPRGAEAAIGIEWQPRRSLPARIVAERRQAIGGEGRSAFALLAHGGVSAERVAGPLQLDAYAQAGVVGLRAADLFADGSARIGLPLDDRLIVGAAAWGGAQPGAARLDVGPEASYRLPDTPLRVSAGYRIRVAGDARPGSGPSLTLGADF